MTRAVVAMLLGLTLALSVVCCGEILPDEERIVDRCTDIVDDKVEEAWTQCEAIFSQYILELYDWLGNIMVSAGCVPTSGGNWDCSGVCE